MSSGPAGALAPIDALTLLEEDGLIGTWSWDFDTEAIHGSSGFCRILGCDPAKPVSFTDYCTLVHPADRDRIGDIGEFFAKQSAKLQRFRIIRPRGEIRWVAMRGTVFHAADGTPLRMAGVAFDVTDVNAALASRQQEQGLLAVVREMFGVVVWKVEADGTVADLVEWRAAVGASGGNHSGWRRLDHVHPDDQQLVREAWAAAIGGRRRYKAEYRARLTDGHYVSLRSSGSPVFDVSGEIAAWVGISVMSELNDPAGMAGMTAPQIRAARAFLGWTIAELAETADVSVSTVRRLESPEGTSVGEDAALRVRTCLEAAGVTLTLERDGGRGIIVRPR